MSSGRLPARWADLMLIAPQSFGAIVQFPGKLIGLAKSIKGVTSAQLLLNAAMTANPIALVVVAVAALAGGLYLLFKKTEFGRQALTAMGHIAKSVFTTSINVAKYAIKGLADWAGWARDKLMLMIPDWLIVTLGRLRDATLWVGEQVGKATEKITDFNERMAANAKIAKRFAEQSGCPCGNGRHSWQWHQEDRPRADPSSPEVVEESGAAAGDWVEAWTAAYRKQTDAQRAWLDETLETFAVAELAIEKSFDPNFILAAPAMDELTTSIDSATASNQRFALSLALIAGEVGGSWGQAMNQMSAMMKAVDEDWRKRRFHEHTSPSSPASGPRCPLSARRCRATARSPSRPSEISPLRWRRVTG